MFWLVREGGVNRFGARVLEINMRAPPWIAGMRFSSFPRWSCFVVYLSCIRR